MSAPETDTKKQTPAPGAAAGGGRLAAGIALTSSALLLLEVSATRLLSFVAWHHFAFMVVSVAVLGLGTAAVALSLSPRLREAPLGRLCALGCMLLAGVVVVAYTILVSVRFNQAKPATGGLQLLRLAAVYAALLLPFVVGGVVIASVLTRRARHVHLFYGADLLGAAAGCLAGVWLAGPLSLEQSFLVSGLLAALAALVFGWPRRAWSAAAGGVAAVAVLMTILGPRWLPARAAPGKEMHLLLEKQSPPARLLETRNTPLGRVDLIASDVIPIWSRNPRVKPPVPRSHQLVIDGSAATPVALIGKRPISSLTYLSTLPSAVGFAFRKPERSLVIGAGGGQDVLAALHHGSQHVDAVEINPAIVSLMKGRLSKASGNLYGRADVRVIIADGRSHVRSTSRRYDSIQLGLVDTWAASSGGGLSLTENFLYTTEAFEDYLARLRPQGVLAVTRWLQRPRREMVRLAVLAAEALEARGVKKPGRHLAIVGVEPIATLLVRREPWTRADSQQLIATAKRMRLSIYYLPGVLWPESNVFDQMFRASSRADFIEDYPYDISPVTDDRPFFFDFHQRRDQPWWEALWKPAGAARSGRATVMAVLFQAIVFSLVLLILPLATRRVRVTRAGGGLLAYFALTGTGFMFLEIPLLQRLTLLVGHPVQAVALVLGVLLGASGLGSLMSARLTGTSRERLRYALLTLGVMAALEAWLGAGIGRAALGAPAWLKPIIAAALVAPLGVLMGLATPHGLRVARQLQPELAPLLWATTSFASVVGSVLAVALALRFGFATAMFGGALCYLLAAMISPPDPGAAEPASAEPESADP